MSLDKRGRALQPEVIMSPPPGGNGDDQTVI